MGLADTVTALLATCTFPHLPVLSTNSLTLICVPLQKISFPIAKNFNFLTTIINAVNVILAISIESLPVQQTLQIAIVSTLLEYVSHV
jgi:hypothetical protein